MDDDAMPMMTRAQLLEENVEKQKEIYALQSSKGDALRRMGAEARDEARRRLGRLPLAPGAEPGPEHFKVVKPSEADWEKVRFKRPLYAEAFDKLAELTAQAEAARDAMVIEQGLPCVQYFNDHVPGVRTGTVAAFWALVGDPLNYVRPSKVWKRASLHTVNGVAARLTKDPKAKQDYVPARRNVPKRWEDSLTKSSKANPRCYGRMYRERKEKELAKLEARGVTVVPGAMIKAANDTSMMIAKQRVDNMATRYAVKRLYEDIWTRAWFEAGLPLPPHPELHYADRARRVYAGYQAGLPHEQILFPYDFAKPAQAEGDLSALTKPVMPAPEAATMVSPTTRERVPLAETAVPPPEADNLMPSMAGSSLPGRAALSPRIIPAVPGIRLSEPGPLGIRLGLEERQPDGSWRLVDWDQPRDPHRDYQNAVIAPEPQPQPQDPPKKRRGRPPKAKGNGLDATPPAPAPAPRPYRRIDI